MNSKFVLAILLVLTPTVYGCVNFGLKYVPNGNMGAYPISARLWDNCGPDDTPTCQYDGYVNNGDNYELYCANGFTAFWTDSDSPDGGSLVYNPPGRGYTIQTPPTTAGDWQYGACVFNCNTGNCFIPGVTPT